MPIQTTPSRIGQVNLAGDADNLFLKVFSGEIISVFEETNLMLPLTKVRTISSGKSATFAVTGVATAAYHTPGESVLDTGASTGYLGTAVGTYGASGNLAVDAGSAKYLSRFRHNEKIVYIDDVLLSSVFVSDIDELKNHYDVRSTYSKEIGRALAIAADKNLIRTVIAGARKTTDRFGVGSGTSTKYLGAQIDISNGSTISAESIIIGLFNLARQMDEKDVPSDNRYAILDPASYYLLVRGDSSKIGVAINKDYGGSGSLAGGTVVEVAGIKILKSNHIPNANESSVESSPHGDSGVKNNVINSDNSGTAGYSGLNYSTTKGIAFHTDGVGTVKLMDLSVESEYYMDRLGTLMLAKYAMGHNVLREECCFELTDPA
jgi:hypothetical protein